MKPSIPIAILVADDDADDRLMTRDAFQESHLNNPVFFVEDGVALMDYLLRRGKFANPTDSPRPGIILLDLNMPKMDGREALREIKAHSELKRIPVIVLTTSKAEEDVLRTYDLGANAFISKPVTFNSLVAVMKDLGRYWLEIVTLPMEVTDDGE